MDYQKQFRKAIFVKSASHYQNCIDDDLPSIGIMGRSNVGKSSLINALADQKKLAKTSNTPGRTQLINYFQIPDLFYLVDFPGFGYAKVSRNTSYEWLKMVDGYLQENRSLHSIFLLIDGRRGILPKDIETFEFLESYRIPFHIIFTKKDKVKSKDYENCLKSCSLLENYGCAYPDPFFVSSQSKENISDLRKKIIDLLSVSLSK